MKKNSSVEIINGRVFSKNASIWKILAVYLLGKIRKILNLNKN